MNIFTKKPVIMLNFNCYYVCPCLMIGSGIVDIIIRVYQTRKEDKCISLWEENINVLGRKLKRKINVDNEVEYIISQSKHIDELLNDGSILSPILDFATEISQGNYYNGFKRYFPLIRSEILCHREGNKQKRRKLWKALINPIELFFRGVDRVLRFLLSYPISLFIADLDYDARPWKVLAGIVSFVSALLSILEFFDIKFNA